MQNIQKKTIKPPKMCLFPVVATWWYFVFVPVFPLTNPKKKQKKTLTLSLCHRLSLFLSL